MNLHRNTAVLTGLMLVLLAIFAEVTDLNKIVFGFGLALLYQPIFKSIGNLYLKLKA